MNEDLIRETLRGAAGGEPPAGEAYAAFQGRLARAARVRALSALALGVASVAAVALAFPIFGPEREAIFVPQTPAPNALRYRDEVVGYELTYPAEWLVVEKEPEAPLGRELSRSVLFFPTGEEDPQPVFEDPWVLERPGSAYVKVDAHACGFEGPAVPTCRELYDTFMSFEGGAGIDAERATTSIGRYEVGVLDQRYGPPPIPERPRSKVGHGYWCDSCVMRDHFLVWSQHWVLTVSLVARDAAWFVRYEDQVEALVASLTRLDG